MSGFGQMQVFQIAMLSAAIFTHSVAAADIGIINTQSLDFGKIVAGTGGGVVVSPAGNREATGGVYLYPSSQGSAAQFNVTGDPNAHYQITLPDDNTGESGVVLTSGDNSMAVSFFTSIPVSQGELSSNGTQTLYVGATLLVGNNQTPGNYSGSFSVMVEYN